MPPASTKNHQSQGHNFRASDHAHDNKKHLLLCASGSVATIKLNQILSALSAHARLSIRLILTPSACAFLSGQSAEQPPLASLLQMPNVDGLYEDASEWAKPWERHDPILHIELRRWEYAGEDRGRLGGCRQCGDRRGPGGAGEEEDCGCDGDEYSPWRQPVTARQIRVLEEEWGVSDEREGEGNGKGSQEGWFEVLRPQEKELARGDVGDGAMREWKEIVKVIEERLGLGSSK